MFGSYKAVMVYSTNSSHRSNARSYKFDVCSSKNTEISSPNPPPLMDEMDKVKAPNLTSTTIFKLIRASYGHFERS